MRTKSRYGESNVFISTHSQWAKESEWDSLCLSLRVLSSLLGTEYLQEIT